MANGEGPLTPLELPGAVTLGDRASWATISTCSRFRYALGRTWDPVAGDWEAQRPMMHIFMLNPSTADHATDDPTIRKVMHFARQEGCGGVLVRNLDAFRATDASELRTAPTSDLNLEVLRVSPFFSVRVAAWGALSTRWLRRRLNAAASQVKTFQSPLSVFGLTRDGDPRHPLYLANATRSVPWAKAAT